MGESASIPLPGFTLDGRARGSLRRSWARLDRSGGVAVEIHDDAGPLLPELREVSKAWLDRHGGRDTGFSHGAFVPAYLSGKPVAVLRRPDGTAVAFTSIWPTPDGRLGIDLMRYSTAAPPGAMDYLLVEVIRWAQDTGLRRVDLGLAPLSGLTGRDPLSRLGRAAARHGERFYGFAGLRHFKAKFAPQWSPRYAAAPHGYQLPLVLARVARLAFRHR